jgi:competence protein ComEC
MSCPVNSISASSVAPGERGLSSIGARVGARPGSPLDANGEPRKPLFFAPLAPLVAALAAGIVVDRLAEPLQTKTWIAMTLVFAAAAVLTARRLLLCAPLFLVAVFALGGGWHHYRWFDVAPGELARSLGETPQPAWVRGIVQEVLGSRHQARGYGVERGDPERVITRFVVDIKAFCDGSAWHQATGRALVNVTGSCTGIQAGQAVQAAGQLARVAAPLNPGEFDYRAFLQAQGIRLRLSVDDTESVWPDPDGSGSWWYGMIGRLRASSRARLVEQLDPQTAPLAAALLLGQRDEIDPEVNDAFARTGTTHLLAISGLQLQALAAALLLLARIAGLPRRPAYLAVAITMFAYASLVGLAPSVVRSTLMTATFCLAAIAQRMDRPANTLSLAALGTLAINPTYLFDVGCQLSFLAIATLVWLVPPACALVRQAHKMVQRGWFGDSVGLLELERRLEPAWRSALRKPGAWLVDGFICSLVVWLAALPLVAMRFHLMSPIGIFLNLPLIPLTSLALLLGGLALGLSAIWGPLGAPAAWASAGLLKTTRAIVLWGVAQPWGHRFVVGTTWGWVVIFYALLALAMVGIWLARSANWPRPYGIWWLLLAWIVPGWLVSGGGQRVSTLEAEVLAVGHGLAVVIETPGGKTYLYDCGRLGDPSVGRRIIAPALWSRGISRIDTVFLSHSDQDHYDGLPDLLDRFSVGRVCVPTGFGGPANPLAVELLKQVQSRGVALEPISAPERWEQDSVTFTVLHPVIGWHPEASDNARSLVLDVAYAGRHLLLTGDLEKEGLDELLERSASAPADVFLAPHHGGKSANPDRLYNWARPRVVVVSQRTQAAGGADVLARVERHGIRVLRTWRDGSIRLHLSAAGIDLRGFLGRERARAVGEQLAWAAQAVSSKRRSASWANTLRVMIALCGFGLGGAVCLVLAVVEIGAWVLIVPPRSLDNRAAQFADHRRESSMICSEPISVTAADGARLAARWYRAAGRDPSGRTVLLLHGFAEDSSSWDQSRAAALTRRGWNVAALDLRGYGQSGGAFATFGAREAGDVRAWLDTLSDRMALLSPESAFRPVLWGRSMGAAISVRTAAIERRVKALVLESPMVDLDASMAQVLKKRRLPFPALFARLVTRRAGRLAGVPIHRPRPVDAAALVICPSLIVHGTGDRIVPIEQARRLARALAWPPCWLDVPGAAHHDVIAVGGDALLDRIASFLDESASAADRRSPP